MHSYKIAASLITTLYVGVLFYYSQGRTRMEEEKRFNRFSLTPLTQEVTNKMSLLCGWIADKWANKR